MYTFSFYYYLGMGVGKIACPPILRPQILLFPFPLSSGFQRVYLPSSVSFSPKSNASHQPPDACTLKSLPWVTSDVPGRYHISYLRLAFFPVMVSDQLLAPSSHPYCFLGFVPKMCHPALLRFGINIFFTYRWYEGYIIFCLLTKLRFGVLLLLSADLYC